MNALIVLTLLIAGAGLLARRRRRARTSTPGSPRMSACAGFSPRTRGSVARWRSMVLVGTILGLQVVIAPPAMAAECGEAPNPERPGSGMVGAMDPAQGHGEKDSPYKGYGYAGMVWHVYETECGPLSGITDPSVTMDTWAGNQLFNIGKSITGATNALHYTVMEGGLFTPLYDAIKSGTEKIYNNIYTQLFGLVAMLLAIWMFRQIWSGDLPSVSKKALFALGALWLAASSFALLRYFDAIDRAIVQTTTNIQAGFVDESESRVVRHILPTNLHNEIVYKNWLRGEFGAPDAPQAKEFGRELLDAQAFTWSQLAKGDDANQAVVDEKKAEYKRIGEELGPATGYFTGEAGGRTGSGFIALLQSIVYSLFQLLAKAAVLLAQVLVRLLALTAPLIGLVALLHNDILRRVAKVAGTVAFNLVVLSVLAGVHALLLNAIFAATTLPMLTQMAMAGLVTILLFVVGRPVRRLWQMVEMSTKTVGAALPGPSNGLLSRFRRHDTGPTAQDEFWQNVRDTDIDVVEAPGTLGTANMSGRRIRPEANNPMIASAQRMDQAGGLGIGTPAGISAGAAAGRAALPPGGSPNPARLGFRPAGGLDGGYAATQEAVRADAIRTRPNYVAPRVNRSLEDYADSVLVPSRISGPSYDSGPESAYTAPAQPQSQAPRTGMRARPMPANSEVIGGREVHVLYRPSRGLEVRQDLRDTDSVVR